MQTNTFKNPNKQTSDWRPDYLSRRHRIDPRVAEIYLTDWARPRWEVKQ